jgi:CHAD domain-containing protein
MHQFRVEYIKLRAFFRMLAAQQGTAGELTVSKKLKKVYTISGSIRDLQLQQVRITDSTKAEQKKPTSYLALLQKEMNSLKPELSEILLENPVNDSKKKTDAAMPDGFPLSGFKNFVQQKWAAVHVIIASGHFSDDNVHLIRKDLKDLFNNLKLYQGVEYDILSITITKGKGAKYFDQLLEELGSFQDKCTAIALLRSNWLTSLNTYNRELLERLKRNWIRDKLSLKQSLVKKLKTDIAPRQAVQ